MSTIQRVELDSTLRCPDAVDFERRLRERVVGQDEAIDKVTWMVQTFMAGFNPPGRPAASCCSWGRLAFRTQKLGKTRSLSPPNPPASSPIYCHKHL